MNLARSANAVAKDGDFGTTGSSPFQSQECLVKRYASGSAHGGILRRSNS